MPRVKAPLKQQSIISTTRRDLVRPSRSSTYSAEIPVAFSRSISVSAHARTAPLVLDAVTRAVEQQDVVRTSVGEEVLERDTDVERRRVDRHLDQEVADLRVAQDVRKLRRVVARRAQRAKLRVPVGVGGDDQRVPRARHANRSLAGGAAVDEYVDQPLLFF